MTRADDLGRLAAELRAEARPGLTFMEVCGTHTMAIARYGLRQLLPDGVRLVSGPGCPVCVTAMADLDRVLALARLPEVTLVTFGDLIRVPASRGTLAAERAAGADVRVVYSPSDAVRIAADEPDRQVVFAGIGFETTAPTTAAALLEARAAGLANFSLLSLHKTMPLPPARAARPRRDARRRLPAARARERDHRDGLLRVPGARLRRRRRGRRVRGRTTCSEALLMLVRLPEPRIAIQYTRAVRPEGNVVAQRLLEQVFAPSDADWRGLGVIPGSGLALREEFAERGRGAPVRRRPGTSPWSRPGAAAARCCAA